MGLIWIYHLVLTNIAIENASFTVDLRIPHGDFPVRYVGLLERNQANRATWICFSQRFLQNIYWLVVLTILKHISQWEGLSHILWKIKMFETTNQYSHI